MRIYAIIQSITLSLLIELINTYSEGLIFCVHEIIVNGYRNKVFLPSQKHGPGGHCDTNVVPLITGSVMLYGSSVF